MANPFTVVITAMIIGERPILPYNHTQGADANLKYKVPLYSAQVGGSNFKVIRFGVVRKDTTPPRKSLVCDCGLAAAQLATPSWHPTYSPRSFQGSSRVGGWVLYPGQGFLMHEGPADNEIGGSLGCIEVCGSGEWNRFLGLIEKLGGADCATLGKLKKMTIKIEPAPRPTATLIA